jgi:hypothetical protein
MDACLKTETASSMSVSKQIINCPETDAFNAVYMKTLSSKFCTRKSAQFIENSYLYVHITQKPLQKFVY